VGSGVRGELVVREIGTLENGDVEGFRVGATKGSIDGNKIGLTDGPPLGVKKKPIKDGGIEGF